MFLFESSSTYFVQIFFRSIRSGQFKKKLNDAIEFLTKYGLVWLFYVIGFIQFYRIFDF